MGLHNANDPRYHQKPGNLFNTYLGKAPPPERESSTRERKRPPRKAQSGRKPKLASDEPKLVTDVLVAFLERHTTLDEAKQFLNLVSKAKGEQASTRPGTYSSIRDFARSELTQTEVLRYLRELQRRKDAGEPLIQGPRVNG